MKQGQGESILNTAKKMFGRYALMSKKKDVRNPAVY